MKKSKKQTQPEPKQLVARFDATTKEWLVEVSPGHVVVFTTKKEAESYCAEESKKASKVTGYHQELPHSSVWTGAPWDRTFEHLN